MNDFYAYADGVSTITLPRRTLPTTFVVTGLISGHEYYRGTSAARAARQFTRGTKFETFTDGLLVERIEHGV